MVSPSFWFSLPEHFVDTEVLLRHEPSLLVGQVVEHTRGHGRGVGPQEVLGRLLLLPVVSVALGPKAATAVNFLNFLQIVFGKVFCCGRIWDEECVVSISCWMLLRLKLNEKNVLYKRSTPSCLIFQNLRFKVPCFIWKVEEPKYSWRTAKHV